MTTPDGLQARAAVCSLRPDTPLIAAAFPARDRAAVVPLDRRGHHAAVSSGADGNAAWTDADGGVVVIPPSGVSVTRTCVTRLELLPGLKVKLSALATKLVAPVIITKRSPPRCDNAKASVAFYHAYVGDNEAQAGDLGGLPATAAQLQQYYDQCAAEATRVYRQIDQSPPPDNS